MKGVTIEQSWSTSESLYTRKCMSLPVFNTCTNFDRLPVSQRARGVHFEICMVTNWLMKAVVLLCFSVNASVRIIPAAFATAGLNLMDTCTECCQ